MAKREDLQKELENLGLSSKQAELYLLLVAHTELRIQEIVELSHTPRSTVYENLRCLYQLGIAEEIVDDNFKRVRAYPIGMMRHVLDEQITTLQQRVAGLEALEKSIGLIAGNDPRSTTIRYYKGRAGARQIYWNTLKTKDTVYVYTEWGRQQYVGLKYYERFVTETRHRQLQERVLINLTPQILETIRQYNLPGTPITRTRVEDIRVIDATVVHIKGDTLMYNDVYAQVYLKNVEINGFEIEGQDFVNTQRSIFETLWNTAQPVTDFLAA
ncbi:MAG TPA: helix-turn-helix domain-containing protein [Patescibacteria group bacterium]|nr:helix-turn-helix domain-containing protein [Patescibacteria group bacterium]